MAQEIEEKEIMIQWRRILGRVAVMATLLIGLLISGVAYWYSLYLSSNGPLVVEKSVTVNIPKGSSVVDIKRILAAENLITDDVRFLLLVRFSGYSNKLQAGEFLLPTNALPFEIIKLLVSARSVQHSITIPEGLRATEIAEVFAAGGWCDKIQFNELVNDPVFIAHIGLGDEQSLEGYLFPDTYYFTKGYRGAEKIVTMMVDRFKEVWSELLSEHGAEADRKKTVILASIVEKETGASFERGLIAGVFHNRLRINMPLQSDPTVVYGLADFSGKITKKNLRTATPYNTYTRRGLPVGPISNPGKKALQAVLSPQESKYLYFVSKNDGTHQFSATLSEHNRAVRKYQRKKSAKKGK